MNKYQKLLIENREKIIKELAERMKDVIYVNCERKAEQVFDKIIMRSVDEGEDRLEITHTFTFVMNDLFQIAVRDERNKHDELRFISTQKK